ncbi:MAG: FAD-dependent thymidylate synthase [Clostridia bacterium]|nr:FAD-dependent thymidylate synthase [Clostridia bacterium]
MNKIQVKLIGIDDIAINTEIACKMTRAGNSLEDIEKFINNLGNFNEDKVNEMLKLPHSKISRFTTMKFLIVGASRRFLSQLITHHVGVDIMSGSLQYSDHSKKYLDDMFVVPYNLLAVNEEDEIQAYKDKLKEMHKFYETIIEAGYTNDDAGYAMPMALRNCLFVQINLEALKWIGNQRLCKRNTDETSYVIGRMIEELINVTDIDDSLFMPTCYHSHCQEGKYCCGKPINKNYSIEPLTGMIIDYEPCTIKQYLDERFVAIR